jgi:hypothetical protein
MRADLGRGEAGFMAEFTGLTGWVISIGSVAPAFCEAVCVLLPAMGDFSIVSPRSPDFPGKSIGYFEGP